MGVVVVVSTIVLVGYLSTLVFLYITNKLEKKESNEQSDINSTDT